MKTVEETLAELVDREEIRDLPGALLRLRVA